MTALFLILATLYLIPSIVAAVRGHHDMAAIVALNVFAGWTFAGWIGALVWSLTAVRLHP